METLLPVPLRRREDGFMHLLRGTGSLSVNCGIRNSKSQSVDTERELTIQKLHAQLRHRVKRGVQVIPKWGCWLPEHAWT